MRTSIFVVLSVAVVACQGCAYFVPAAIKREAAMVHVDIKAALVEVPPLRQKAARMLNEADVLFDSGDKEGACRKYRKAALQAQEATDKAMRSYARTQPHAENLRRYMLRKPPEGD